MFYLIVNSYIVSFVKYLCKIMVVSLQSSSDDVRLSEAEVVNKTKHNFKTKIGNKYSATGIKSDVLMLKQYIIITLFHKTNNIQSRLLCVQML